VFTVDRRDGLRDRVLRLGQDDDRVIGGAAVGSLAVDEGDSFSDLDLTFGIAEPTSVAAVLADWTNTLIDEMGAVKLVDLERDPTIYRVLLFPDALQFDLSMTPASEFRPAGPRFRLLFGQIAAGRGQHPRRRRDAVHSNACGCRGSPRLGDHLRASRSRVHRATAPVAGRTLRRCRARSRLVAGLPRSGLPAVQARGYDQLPAATLQRFEHTHVTATEPHTLNSALRASVTALLQEAADADVPNAEAITERVGELAA